MSQTRPAGLRTSGPAGVVCLLADPAVNSRSSGQPPVAHRAPEENSDVALPQWQTAAEVSKSSRCHRGVSTGLRINFRHRLGRTDLSSATGYRTVSVSALWVILESLVRGLISGAIFVIVILQPCVAMHPRRTGYSHAAARWVALG